MAKKKITELSQSLLNVGDKFFFTRIRNPHCEGYGMLTVTKIAFEATKFCTNPCDWGGYLHKEHYIDRPSVIIYWKDSAGKKGNSRYWLDEWNGDFGKKSVKVVNDASEVEYHFAKGFLDDNYRTLLNACRSTHGNILSLVLKTKDEKDKKVLRALVALRDAVIDAQKETKKYSWLNS